MSSNMTVTLSGHYIEIEFPYNASLVKRVREIPDREYVTRNGRKYWRIPHTAWHAAQFAKHFDVTEFPEIAKLASGFKELPAIQHTDGLYPFQETAVKFILANNGRALVADDMGLGKTVEILAALTHLKPKRGFVIAPATVVLKWVEEDKVWGNIRPVPITTTKTEMPLDQKTWSYVMSYDMMRLRAQELLDGPVPDYLVFDECHYLKNYKAQRTRVATRWSKGVSIILGASGTPFPNRPMEMFPMLNIIDSKMWPNFWQFGKRYCWSGVDFSAAINREELSERLKNTMIRRTKDEEEIKKQLPSLTRSFMPMENPGASAYRALKKEITQKISELEVDGSYYQNVLQQLNILRQYVGTLKVAITEEWVQNFLKQTDRKLVIYCHHLNNIRLVKDMYDEWGVVTITGDDSQKKREEVRTVFQNDLYGPRIMAITSAGGEGINLFGIGDVKCGDILFIEREWTPAKEEQAEARLHRLGQHSPVLAHYPIVLNTLDERMHRQIEAKRQVIRDIVGLFDVELSIVGDILFEELGIKLKEANHGD